MVHIIFNLPGLVMLVVAFATAIGVGQLVGVSAEGPLMIIASPLLLAADLVYRGTRTDQQWFHPSGGGMLFFVPIWAWGIFWLVLGIVYAATK